MDVAVVTTAVVEIFQISMDTFGSIVLESAQRSGRGKNARTVGVGSTSRNPRARVVRWNVIWGIENRETETRQEK